MGRGLATALSLGAGVLVAMQAPINGRLGRSLGPFQAASVSFLIGLLLLVALAALSGGGLGPIVRTGHQPWWYLLGGLLGAAYVTVALTTVARLA